MVESTLPHRDVATAVVTRLPGRGRRNHAGRPAPHVACARSWPRVMAYGRLRAGEPPHRWPRAEVPGDATAYRCPSLLSRAEGEAEAVRQAWRHALVPPLGSPGTGRVIEAPGVPRKGRHSTGVAEGWSGAVSGRPRSGPPRAWWGGRRPRGPRSCGGSGPAGAVQAALPPRQVRGARGCGRVARDRGARHLLLARRVCPALTVR